jgi:ferrous iron transport protein B
MNPFGRFIGVDGVILTAFLLGFPANEIVIPVMLMCYLSTGTLTDFTSLTQLQDILINCGWTLQTAVSVIILCIFHFPCGTTCLTIKKETGSLKWTALAIIIPTLTGVLLCLALNIILLAF